MIENTQNLIKLHEGFRGKPYYDSTGHLTIGYGRNLVDVGISEQEADGLFLRDYELAVACLVDRIYFWLDLSEVRQAVLIDMVFNLGWPKLAKFSRFLSALEAGDYVKAADEMVDSLWYRQTKSRARRLVGMMLSNEWPRELLDDAD